MRDLEIRATVCSALGPVCLAWVISLGCSASGATLPIDVDPGPLPLEPWVAQQRVDLTGAMQLTGAKGLPDPKSVQV